MTTNVAARTGNRNAAGPRALNAARSLHREARGWVAHRGWRDIDSGPSLAGHYVAVVTNGTAAAVGVFRTSDPAPRSPSHVAKLPEHAKRYVEHVHNFGRPPY